MSVEIGLGVLAIVIAGVAVWIAVSSDRKMKAIANLEFDEKRAVLEVHRSNLNTAYSQSILDPFILDVEAIANVAKYADKDKRTRAADAIDSIIPSVQPRVPQDTVSKLRVLSSRIRH